jgi:hypothetical protein
MTAKDANTCAEFWKHIRALTEISHTRGAEGLVDALMEDFAHLSEADGRFLRNQLTSLLTALPLLKQANASKAPTTPKSHQIPYRD